MLFKIAVCGNKKVNKKVFSEKAQNREIDNYT